MPRPVTRAASRLFAALLPLLVLLAVAPPEAGAAETPAGHAARPPKARVLCHLEGSRIIESSGLVDHGPLLFTTNDSGDGPYLYGVAKATGRTVVTTTYSSDRPTDVEALAPGGHGSVWVGDIGDNTARRSSIAVYHVREHGLPEQVNAPRYTLSYPDGPHNAETLLASPSTGRLYVVTKALTGGTVYAAPTHLEAGHRNQLRRVTDVPGLITDGAFLPDGRHVVLRTYGTATVYTFPGFEALGTFRLPAQRQGEGLAVSARGTLYLSSEGRATPILEVALPVGVATRADAPAATGLGPSPSSPPATMLRQHRHAGPRSTNRLLWIGVAAVVAAVAVWVLITFALPRSRRRQ